MDSDTLFLCRFNQALDADFAKGKSNVISGKATFDAAGRFGSALSARAGQFAIPTYSAQDNIDPDHGTIEFWFKPDFSRNQPNQLAIYRLFSGWSDKGKEGVGIGLNRYPEGDVCQLWFYAYNERLDPKSYGVDKAVSIKKGQWHHIAACWDKKTLSLYLDDKLLGVKDKIRPLDFGDTFAVGGDPRLPIDVADGLIDEFRISSVCRYELPGAPVKMELSNALGTATLKSYYETGDLISFRTEANCPVRFEIRPQVYPITPGGEYLVNTSDFGPLTVKAAKDGTLVFELDSPRNCTVIIERPKSENLLPNPSFESVDKDAAIGWSGAVTQACPPYIDYGVGQYQFIDANYRFLDKQGAELEPNPPSANIARMTENFKRTGRRGFQLTQAGNGMARLESAGEIPLQAGKEYLFSGYYHLENPQFGSTLNFSIRLTSGGVDLFPMYGEPQEWLLNPLIVTGPGEWRRAFVRFTVPTNGANAKAKVCINAQGAPFSAYWDDLSLTVAPTPIAQGEKEMTATQLKPRYNPEEVKAIMKTRRATDLKITRESGQPRLWIDGKPEPLFGYVGNPYQWPRHSSHSDMVQAGVRLHYVPVVLSNPLATIFGDQPIWLGKDTYDFADLDKKLCEILGYDIDARVMFYLHMDPYPEFGDLYPDAVWRNTEGRKTIGTKGQEKAVERRGSNEAWNISYTAREFRQQGSAALRALARHLNSVDIGKAVVGIHMTCGSDGQWFSMLWPDWQDCSPANVEAFRDWLRRRYDNNLKEFRKAWGEPALTFETAPLAKLSERETKHAFYNPNNGADRRLIDANLFAAEGVAETINLFARSFKDAMQRPVMVSTYYSDAIHGHGIGHNALKVLLDQPDLDGITSVMEYGLFRSLGRTGCFNSLVGSLRLHNKLFRTELDNRTDYSYITEENRRDYGVPRGEEATADQIRRDLGMSLCQGEGGWIYGLSGNSWANEKYIAGVAEIEKAAELAALFPVPSDRGQVAVFADEQLLAYTSSRRQFGYFLSAPGHYSTRNALNQSGLPWDAYLLSDLDNPERPDYKINIFLSSVSITPEQIAWIEKKMQKKGRVLVFINAAGYCLGEGFEPNIRRLTGMKIKADAGPYTYRFAWLNYPGELTEGPLFYVDDPSATPMAQLINTDKVVLASKRFDDWTSYYISLPGGFTPRILRQIAAEANVTPIGPEGDATFAGNGFIVIHALASGEKSLKWQGKCNLLDITSGTIAATNAETYTFPMKALTTRWFRRVAVEP